ncbi:MAG: redox-sensing transcriptional repressor Rex [Acidobacteria bacterium]|nr:redox-sensing transcriptional repressor Rex [Acidobacteriota bacterium]
MKSEKISQLTTNRLSIYLRCLKELAGEGQTSVSSDSLADRFHLNSAQIRKDLAYFGEFGIRGVGYDIALLRDHIIKILGLDRSYNLAIIGAGRLGSAVVDYEALRLSSFHVKALFDVDPKKIGKKVGGIVISDLKNFQSVAKKVNIDIAVIAVPAHATPDVFEKIKKAGIKAVLNFAPVRLNADDEMRVRSLDVTSGLENLSYFLTERPQTGERSKPAGKARRSKE